MEKLYVVTCISNPRNFESRYKLYREFKQYLTGFSDSVVHYNIELAIGDQEFMTTVEGNPFDIQVRTSQEIWHKENLLNIAINQLPPDAKYVAWIDADIIFTNPNWVSETIEALQTYDVVQMFSEYVDLGLDYQILNRLPSFMAKVEQETEMGVSLEYDTRFKGATGLAWAARVDTIRKLNGLLDWCVIGSGDWYMAHAMVGIGNVLYTDWMTQGYRDMLDSYIALCEMHVDGNVGCVRGTAVHFWHGPKVKRGYNWRWRILEENLFNPIHDLYYDESGLLYMDEKKVKMLGEIKDYFSSRDEDSNIIV